MPRINFAVGMEGSADVARALQGLTAVMKRAFADMRTEAARTSAAMVAGQRKAVESERTAISQRRVAVTRAYDEWKRAENALTDAVSRGSHDRERIASREAASRAKYLNSLKSTASQVERAYTQAMDQESRRRDTIRAREERSSQRGGGGGGGRGFGSAARATLSGATTFAQDMHGQIQEARHRRAGTYQTLAGAMTQIGAGRGDVQAAMGRVSAMAARHGLSADDLAGAINAAQTEFSALGNRADFQGLSAGERSSRMQSVLQENLNTAVRGRNLGADPAEFTRLAGMFRQNRITGIDDLLARTVAMAQQGAIEPAAVTRQAMAPILRRVSAAMDAAGSDPTARATAGREAYTEAFAELQVLRSRGYNPRLAGQNMANLNQALTGNVMAERMRNNLQVVAGTATGPLRDSVRRLLGSGEGGLFEADPEQRGRMRLRQGLRGSATSVAAQLAEAGLSQEQVGNIVAGGGRSNPQSFQRNWSAMTRALMSGDAEGSRGYEVIKNLRNANLSSEDQTRMADVYENSPAAQLARNEESRLTALTDNTNALVRLSDSVANWQAAHPVLNSAGQIVPGVVGGALPALVRGGLGAGGIGAGLGFGGGAGAGGAGAGTLALGGAGVGTGIAVGAVAMGAGMYMGQRSYMEQQGLQDGDYGFWGTTNLPGGEESVHNLVQENDRNRLQRQMDVADAYRNQDLGLEATRRHEAFQSEGNRNIAAEFFGPQQTRGPGGELVTIQGAPPGGSGPPGAPGGQGAAVPTLTQPQVEQAFRAALSSTSVRVTFDSGQIQHMEAVNASSRGANPFDGNG